MPPVALRRGGQKSRDSSVFLQSAGRLVQALIKHCSLNRGSSVLDIGCGPARLLYGILSELGAVRSYMGVDVDQRSITWLSENIAPALPYTRFERIDFFNERYNKAGVVKGMPAVSGGDFDVIALMSVFSHMHFEDIELYLRLIASKLSASGYCYLTMFVEDNVPLEEENPPEYHRPWKGPLHCVRINRTAFDEAVVRSKLSIHVFQHAAHTRQSLYVLRRAPAS